MQEEKEEKEEKMKIKLFLYIILAALLAACSANDRPTKPPVVKDYSGYFILSAPVYMGELFGFSGRACEISTIDEEFHFETTDILCVGLWDADNANGHGTSPYYWNGDTVCKYRIRCEATINFESEDRFQGIIRVYHYPYACDENNFTLEYDVGGRRVGSY